jgi:predicted transcriptional regulator
MGKLKKVDALETDPLLEEEDEATLAAIDRGIKAADEGRVVPLEKVRQRLKMWRTKSSSRKTR